MTLMPTWVWGDLDLTDSPFGIAREQDEVDFGAPQTATEALAQLLLDGEIELSPRASNRTISFTVYVDFTDLLAAAEAERLLALEADKKRNTLTFDPGDGYAPVTVFETFRAELSFVRSDIAEAQGLRRYDVTMKAYPFARSADLVETVALGTGVASPTVTTINAGTATTGWTGRLSVTDSGSYLRVVDQVNNIPNAKYTPGAPVDLSTTPYVSLVMWGFTGTSPRLFINGGSAELVASAPTSTPNQTRYYWLVPPATTTSSFQFDLLGGGLAFNFNSLQRTDGLPTIGTARQLRRSVAVQGSARTQGSLTVEHASSALGATLVYTWPPAAPDYSPPLRSRRVSGASTTDSSLVSGARDLLDTALIYDVPVSALIAGTHLLMARLKSDTVSEQSITYTAQLRQGSNNVGAATTGAVPVPFGSTGTWRNVVLARLMLPPTDVPAGSTAVVRITIVATNAAASNIDLDEAWLFNTSVGDLSWVECGTAAPSAGGSSNRLWLNAATTDVPRPTIYRGFAADQTDAAYPVATEVLSFGTHRFEPPLMNVFTVTSNALDAAVTLTHFARWQTHAAS